MDNVMIIGAIVLLVKIGLGVLILLQGFSVATALSKYDELHELHDDKKKDGLKVRNKIIVFFIVVFLYAVFVSIETEYRPKNKLDAGIESVEIEQTKEFKPSSDNLGQADSWEDVVEKNEQENKKAIKDYGK